MSTYEEAAALVQTQPRWVRSQVEEVKPGQKIKAKYVRVDTSFPQEGRYLQNIEGECAGFEAENGGLYLKVFLGIRTTGIFKRRQELNEQWILAANILEFFVWDEGKK
jgi:hypothetical protein